MANAESVLSSPRPGMLSVLPNKRCHLTHSLGVGKIESRWRLGVSRIGMLSHRSVRKHGCSFTYVDMLTPSNGSALHPQFGLSLLLLLVSSFTYTHIHNRALRPWLDHNPNVNLRLHGIITPTTSPLLLGAKVAVVVLV